MEWFKVNAKAVVVFVLTVVLQAVTDIVNGSVAVDLLDWKGVLRYVGLSLIAAAVVWATGNKLDVGQILAGIKKLNVPEQTEVAKEALTKLPDPVSDNVVQGYPHWVTG